MSGFYRLDEKGNLVNEETKKLSLTLEEIIVGEETPIPREERSAVTPTKPSEVIEKANVDIMETVINDDTDSPDIYEDLSGVAAEVEGATETTLKGRNKGRPNIQTRKVKEEDNRVSPKALMEDPELQKRRDDFLRMRFGEARIDTWDNSKRNQKFLNMMRFYHGGNTLDTANELMFMSTATDEERAQYKDGVELFESVSGTKGDLGDKVDMYWDYARSVVLDPVNYIGVGVAGKVAGVGAARIAAQKAGQLTTKQVMKSLEKDVAKGIITKEAARDAAERAGNKTWAAAMEKQIPEVMRDKMAKRIGIATVVDATTNVAVDAAFQKGMMKIGKQEDFNKIQSGVSAMIGVLGGGFEFARSMKAMGKEADIFTIKAKDPNTARKVLFDHTKEMAKNTRKWKTKVEEGKLVSSGDPENNFWMDFFYGDDSAGYKGFMHSLQAEGYFWEGPNDQFKNVTDWVSAIVEKTPPKEFKAFVKQFSKTYGLEVGKELNQQNLSQKQFSRLIGNSLASTMSDAGRNLGVMSRVAKDLGKPMADLTPEDMAKAAKKAAEPAEAGKIQKAKDFLGYAQEKYPEFLVSNPGTSAINVIGWAQRSGLQTASDVLNAGGHLVGGLIRNIAKGEAGDASFNGMKTANALYKANLLKLRNVMRPNDTAATYESFLRALPESTRDLATTMGGGVEKQKARYFTGLDDEIPGYQKVGNSVSDFARTISFVQAQDTITKGVEFMYAMEKGLQKHFGKSVQDIINSEADDIAPLLRSEEFQKVVADSVRHTQEAVFSRSARATKQKTARHVGTFIEELRSTPGLGVLVPFGRFFNNTVMMAHDFSPLAIATKGLKISGDDVGWDETVAKAMAGVGAAFSLSLLQEDNIKEGRPWNEFEDPNTGELLDITNMFPLSHIAAVGRMWAYARMSGQETGAEYLPKFGGMPDREWKEIMGVVGPGALTRNLERGAGKWTEVAQNILDNSTKMAAGEPGGFIDLIGGMGATMVGGYTRFLEPINMAAMMVRDSENAGFILDAKQDRTKAVSALKYMDQIPRALGWLDESEPKLKSSPTQGKAVKWPSKFGGKVPAGKQTALNQVMSYAGIPEWDVGLRSSHPKAANFINKVFLPVAEPAAAEFLKEHPNFADYDLETRKSKVSDLMEGLRKQVVEFSLNNPDTQQIAKIFDMTKTVSVKVYEDILKAKEVPGLEEYQTLDDLPYSDLLKLEEYLKFRKERVPELQQREFGNK